MKVYFDNAATTKPCPEAIAAMVNALGEDYGNPSSGYELGRRAGAVLRDSREAVARAMGAKSEEIFFTSGGTEGDNWAIRASAHLMRHRGKHIITGETEHDAVRATMKHLEDEGWEVTYLKPDGDGRITSDAVSGALREDTVLVSLMLVNNEIGSVNPISEISAAVKAAGCPAIIHTDAVQGFLKIPFTPSKLGVDLVTVSSHKIHGPKGSGALYIRKGQRLPQLLFGGGQENGIRPGTEAMPAISGFAAAAKVGKEHFKENVEIMSSVKEHTLDRLRAAIPGIITIGKSESPHIVNISLPGYRSEVLMNYLDAQGIAVSKSSACKKGGRSHVLEAMRLPSEVIDGAIRLSFSRYSTLEEGDYFAEKLSEAVSMLKHR